MTRYLRIYFQIQVFPIGSRLSQVRTRRVKNVEILICVGFFYPVATCMVKERLLEERSGFINHCEMRLKSIIIYLYTYSQDVQSHLIFFVMKQVLISV